MQSEYLIFLQNLRNDLFNRNNYEAASKVQLEIDNLNK